MTLFHVTPTPTPSPALGGVAGEVVFGAIVGVAVLGLLVLAMKAAEWRART